MLCRIQLYATLVASAPANSQTNFSHTFVWEKSVAGLTICRHGGYKCRIEHEEFNGTKIIFIGQSIRKLLMRTPQSTNYAVYSTQTDYRQLFDQVWEVKPCRGRQRKMWGKRVDDTFIFEALLLDKED